MPGQNGRFKVPGQFRSIRCDFPLARIFAIEARDATWGRAIRPGLDYTVNDLEVCLEKGAKFVVGNFKTTGQLAAGAFKFIEGQSKRTSITVEVNIAEAP